MNSYLPKLLLVALLPLTAAATKAQTTPADTVPPPPRQLIIKTDSTEMIFDVVEVEASFPGGESAWRRFLEQNLNAAVPANNRAPAGTYTVVIQFVVDKDGKVSDIKALTHHGYGMEGEVIRLLRKAPRWSPAVADGQKVRAYRKQPVTFMVVEEEKKHKRKNRD